MTSYSEMVLGAVKDAEQGLTRSLRRFVHDSGWPVQASRSLRVQSDGTDLFVESFSEEAANLEYGDGESRPSASIRQFANRPDEPERIILATVERNLRGLL